MLVLSRKVEQSIVLGGEIVISVLALEGGRVRLGISAPVDVPIRRGELAPLDSCSGPLPARISTAGGAVVIPALWQ
jgi:carbon storage regulator